MVVQLPISKDQARSLYDAAQDTAHDFDHVMRVYVLAERIGAVEGADPRVLLTATLLHDIGRPDQQAGNCENHALAGARRARVLLPAEDPVFVAAVEHAIAAHSMRGGPISVQPESLEAKVLFDADKLDATGAVGIARVFAYGAVKGRPLWTSSDPDRRSCLRDFQRMLKVKDTLYTSTAREMARQRHEFAVEFYERMNDEVEDRSSQEEGPDTNGSGPLSIDQARKLYCAVTDSTHDFDHVLRVCRLAEWIGMAENARLDVLLTAALLHDIARFDQDIGQVQDHAVEGALQASALLSSETQEFSAAVAHAIATHRFRGNDAPPMTLEAKILYDADKLDAIGAVGIARAFNYGAQQGQPLWTAPEDSRHSPVKEFAVKLSRLKDMLYTRTARDIAEERHAYMARFFNRLDSEINGNLD